MNNLKLSCYFLVSFWPRTISFPSSMPRYMLPPWELRKDTMAFRIAHLALSSFSGRSKSLYYVAIFWGGSFYYDWKAVLHPIHSYFSIIPCLAIIL
jgi:hypothetical protein